MKSPTVKRLVATFRNLTPTDARLIKRLCSLRNDRDQLETLVNAKCPATAAYARACYNDPFTFYTGRTSLVLDAIDNILNTDGVETVGDLEASGPDFEYLNAGDMYDTTLIYDRAKDRLFIGDVGSLIESLETNESEV